MTSEEIEEQLRRIASAEDFPAESGEVVDTWASLGVGIEAVAPVLQFIEEHPEVDFGAPGPLVHFVERFYGSGYEERLLESLGRQPRMLTVWMLNRIMNGVTPPDVRQRLIRVMQQVGDNSRADQDTRRTAARFIERFSG